MSDKRTQLKSGMVTLERIKSQSKGRKALETEEYDFEDSGDIRNEIIASNVLGRVQQSGKALENEIVNKEIKKALSDEDLGKFKMEDDQLRSLVKMVSALRRQRYKNGRMRSNFADIVYEVKPSILDSDEVKNSVLVGFYTPFWLAVAIMMLNAVVAVLREKGLKEAVQGSRILQIFFSDLFWIAFCDAMLYLAMFQSFFLQWAIAKGWFSWQKVGKHLQNLYEFSYITGALVWIEYQRYQWIGKVFLILHSLVFLMKIHSYAYYNGYLWGILDELKFSRGYLKRDLDDSTREILQNSIEFCEFEINKSSKTQKFPQNLTLWNFFEYTLFPTVVYEIDYPRLDKIRWGYVGTKILGIFGIIGVMIVIAQEQVYPVAIKAINMRDMSIFDRICEYPFVLLDLIPAFFLLYILVFILIWELILNAIAELTYFADREFYGPWWNSVSWDDFARLWNVPVHKFLLRHVYHGSISAFQLSKLSATLTTFVLSSFVHEMVMYVIFGKIRFYLFAIQMYQLPLVAIHRTRFLRDKKVLGNVIFWFGISMGAALVSSLYLMF